MLKLALRYMRYYKNQTLAILFSIILTAALLAGISSLLYSNEMNDLENNRSIYGDWHYKVEVNEEQFENILQRKEQKGYRLEECGHLEIREAIEEPYRIVLESVDATYQTMLHREIIQGKYPVEENEIAGDLYTLGNLGFTGNVGDTLTIGEKKYIVTGIVNSEWVSNQEFFELFVGENFVGNLDYHYAYLKFDEGEKLYKQLDCFLNIHRLNSDFVENNDEVITYLSGEKPDRILDIIHFGLHNKEGNFTYIILKLQSEYHLGFYMMLVFLCIFSILVIYSVFHISVSKRMSQYAILQTLGATEGNLFGALTIELWILFLIGYPVGVTTSMGFLKVFYDKLGKAWGDGTSIRASQIDTSEQIIKRSKNIYIAWNVVLMAVVLLFIALIWIAFMTLRSIRKQSLNDIMKETSLIAKKHRKIYCLSHRSLSNVLIKKFMFTKKRKFFSILISLSFGGCIFLCTTYMVENLKIHAELSMKSDDGLNSEYCVSLKTDQLSDTIPISVVDTIKSNTALDEVYATKYTLGEIEILKQELKWENYFDEMNGYDAFQRDFNGICVEKDQDHVGIKYDVYGYEDTVIKTLNDYLLEGSIDLEKLNDNRVIVVANMDGQGNYNFYGKHPGDEIKLRVPKMKNYRKEALKFTRPSDEYVEVNLKIQAIVTRTLVNEHGFLNQGGWDNAPSIILSNEQMVDYFGIENYHMINASPKENENTMDTVRELLVAIKDVPRATLKDYSTVIIKQKSYLERQQLFFSGIAVIVLIISLFHIMNSMHYSILARRHEFGILRAMGITDEGFYRMIAKEGLLYGFLANVLIFLVYNIVLRRFMIYYMQHVVQFLHIEETIPNLLWIIIFLLNLIIALISVMIPARQVVKSNIINEIVKNRGC